MAAFVPKEQAEPDIKPNVRAIKTYSSAFDLSEWSINLDGA